MVHSCELRSPNLYEGLEIKLYEGLGISFEIRVLTLMLYPLDGRAHKYAWYVRRQPQRHRMQCLHARSERLSGVRPRIQRQDLDTGHVVILAADA